MEEYSEFQKARQQYTPKLPPALLRGAEVRVVEGKRTSSAASEEAIAALFPHIFGSPLLTFVPKVAYDGAPAINAGVIFSGGQAPGGHNVAAGLFDGLKSLDEGCRLYGFTNGPDGLIKNKYKELTVGEINRYRNTGGFDLICSSRTKLEKIEQFESVARNCSKLDISAVVIIGGDDSNTNACLLAEFFVDNNIPIQVIGCPKTIDGDLKNQWIESSFGFDTASKVYSGLIGNIERDALSAGKYWHFIKLMGRSASHLTLECALQAHPNVTLISEEIQAQNIPLSQIVNEIAEVVAERSSKGMNFGVVLVPEGLIEFIPEIGVLIGELNDIFAKYGKKVDALDDFDKESYITRYLTSQSSIVYQSLPTSIRAQLCAERDPHGNVQVSVVETEKMLAEMVQQRLRGLMQQGRYSASFHPAFHFFGYEGRCAAPSNFDANYCYSIGYNAAALIAAGKTGYMSCIGNTDRPSTEWVAGGVPLTAMMNMERRKGEDRPVIKKSLVDLEGRPFQYFRERRQAWKNGTEYRYPCGVQYFGPAGVCDEITMTLRLEKEAQKEKTAKEQEFQPTQSNIAK